ncbi:hypothetical protein FOCC_FOCC006244 [Frankliniella occidentalis]|nr:hypothetical protein FOCC_FOCC006244 [Frankliniella occidentalis]
MVVCSARHPRRPRGRTGAGKLKHPGCYVSVGYLRLMSASLPVTGGRRRGRGGSVPEEGRGGQERRQQGQVGGGVDRQDADRGVLAAQGARRAPQAPQAPRRQEGRGGRRGRRRLPGSRPRERSGEPRPPAMSRGGRWRTACCSDPVPLARHNKLLVSSLPRFVAPPH